MARIKHQDIINKFVQTFLADETLTSSEWKMQSIKLSQLKKTVKQYLIEANVDTDKSVEQIIMEEIDYCAMLGKKFKSIASLGYSDLGKSIDYWVKHEKAIQAKKEEEERAKQESADEEKLKKLVEENMKKRTERKLPKWMLEDD